MTVASDRSAPGVRITVLPSEKALAGEPLQLHDRILGFVFEDSETQADKASIQLDNFDLALFDRDDLTGGACLEVSWGYPGAMAPPRRVVVKKLKGFSVLTLEGQATSVLLNQHAKTRAWKGLTRSEVARNIATEHGFEGPFVDIEETAEVFDVISQAAETDARFLRRLAAREGFFFAVDDGGFHWKTRDFSTTPTHVLTWFSDPGRGDVLSVNVESDLVRRVGHVAVRGRDPIAKTTIDSSASSATVDRSTLGNTIEVVDPRTGTTSLQQRNATASVQPTSAASGSHATRESAARFRQAERDTVKLAVQVVGDPTLRAKTVVEMRGISKLLSGKYYVVEAKHVLSSAGYVVDLKLTRDGHGQRSGAQPQGGQPNRSTPAAGGALSPVEVIDPRTGSSHVEFRREGRVLGSEDPEAAMSRVR